MVKLRLVNPVLNLLVINKVYRHYYRRIFIGAVKQGNVDLMVHIYNLLDGHSSRQSNLLYGYGPYCGTACEFAFGDERVLDQLNVWLSEKQRESMIKKDDYRAFRDASMNGHIGIVKRFLSWISPDMKLDMISSEDWKAFHLALHNEHMDVVKEIFACTSKDEIYSMLLLENFGCHECWDKDHDLCDHHYGCSTFRLAAQRNLARVEELYAWADKKSVWSVWR